MNAETRTGGRLLLTGGATGLGREIADQARTAGYDIVVLDRTPSTHSRQIVVDLQDSTAALEATRAAIDLLGGLDALVLCAGINRPERFEHQDFVTWKSVLEVNVLGNAAVTSAALAHLKASRGRIVGIGSTASRRLTSGMSAYGTSKHAFTAFLHGVALEEMGNLGVSLVHPGLMDTGFFEGRRPEYMPPIKELLNPSDVASAVLFCLSQPADVAVRDLFITDFTVNDWP